MSTRKFYKDKRRLFGNADEMSTQLLRYQPSAMELAASYVGTSHAQDIFDEAVEYFLRQEMWKKEYYCLSAFRQLFIHKIHWCCLDLLKSPHFALLQNMVISDTPEDVENTIVDPESLIETRTRKSAVEEIRNSLTQQEQKLFDDIFYNIKPRDIACEQSKSVKTIRNKKSKLLSLIRRKYANGEYSFCLEELSALDRTVGILYGWEIQAFPMNESDTLLD